MYVICINLHSVNQLPLCFSRKLLFYVFLVVDRATLDYDTIVITVPWPIIAFLTSFSPTDVCERLVAVIGTAHGPRP